MSWAALGGHPAPGDPEQLRLLARSALRLATGLERAADDLGAVATTSGVWCGPAARGYRDQLAALPQQLHDGARALAALHRSLLGFADRLEAAQRHAQVLRREAEVVREALGRDPAAHGQLLELRHRAELLRTQVEGDAAGLGRVLAEAAQRAPEPPGWLHRFVTEHPWVLEVASFTSSVAASVTAATGVGLPVAAVLAGLSLAATMTLRHYGEADEGDVVLALAGTASFGAAAALRPVAASVGSLDDAARLGGRLPGPREVVGALRETVLPRLPPPGAGSRQLAASAAAAVSAELTVEAGVGTARSVAAATRDRPRVLLAPPPQRRRPVVLAPGRAPDEVLLGPGPRATR